MALSHSVSFRGPADRVWGAVVKLVMAAGHPVVRTDQAARQIVFQASGGWMAYTQEVQVSVVGIDANETIVTIAVAAHGQETLTEGGKQQELVDFVVEELSKKFPLFDEEEEAAPPSTPARTATGGSTGTLVIMRASAMTAAMYAVEVILAGKVVGKVKNGGTLTVQLPAGQHQVQVRGGGLKNAATVRISGGKTTQYEMSFSMWGALGGGLIFKPA